MDIRERCNELFDTRGFGSLSDDLRKKTVNVLIDCGKQLQITKGTELIRAGDSDSNYGFILLQGEIEVRRPDAPDISRAAPELLGEMKQFSPTNQRTATVQAATHVEVLQFHWRDFHDSLMRDFTQDEQDTVLSALKEYAWKHFTE